MLYREVNRCNAAVTRANDVIGMADSVKNSRIGEAKFLRSLSFFWAVQQWGDIPMPLTETTSGSLVVKKTAAKDVYTQIITDLNDAIAKLPATQKDAGRVTKGAAQFLLARVKRMAFRAYFNVEGVTGNRRAGSKFLTATTGKSHIFVAGVNIFFHKKPGTINNLIGHFIMECGKKLARSLEAA
jgi:hypothetical protein